MVDSLKEKSINSFGWKLAQSVCTLGSSFVIQIILARILLPEDFGIVAITTVFMTLANTIIETGFSSSVIQKSEMDQKQLSSVFFANIILSFAVYMALFLIAPMVAMFYKEPVLASILRVQGLRVLFSALYSIQASLLNRRMEFKKIFISYLIGAIVQGIVGIAMALGGFGVWALVVSTIINYVVAGVIMIIFSRWMPSLYFSFKLIKSSISFSSKVLVVDVIQKVFYNVRSLAIGKVYSSAVLGLFNKGFQFPSTAMTVVDGSFVSVAFTSLSKLQNDKEKFLSALRSYVKIMTYLTTPLMFGMLMVAKPMVEVLLTSEWLSCVPYVQMICIIYLFKPLLIKSQALNAIGRSDVSMCINTFGVILSVIFIVLSVPFSPYIMVMSEIISTLFLHISFAIVSKKLFGYSYKLQAIDFCRPMVPSVLMCGAIYLVSKLSVSNYVLLILEILIGMVVYFAISKITNDPCLKMIVEYGRQKFKQ